MISYSSALGDTLENPEQFTTDLTTALTTYDFTGISIRENIIRFQGKPIGAFYKHGDRYNAMSFIGAPYDLHVGYYKRQYQSLLGVLSFIGRIVINAPQTKRGDTQGL